VKSPVCPSDGRGFPLLRRLARKHPGPLTRKALPKGKRQGLGRAFVTQLICGSRRTPGAKTMRADLYGFRDGGL